MATTFNGREVADNINVNDVQRNYDATSKMAGQKYHRASWGKLGFTVSPAFYNAFKSGKVQRLTIEAGTYFRDDVATGQKVEVPNATLLTWLTLDQVLAQDSNETLLIEGGTKLQVAKAKAEVVVKGAKFTAMKELGLDGPEMAKLMEMI